MDTPQTELRTETNVQDGIPHDDLFAHPVPGIHLFFRGGGRDDTAMTITRNGKYRIGRREDAEIKFGGGNSVDSKVSRRHAVLHVDPPQVKIVNCAPRNGLKVDGIPLRDHQELLLRDADVITLGDGGPIIRVRIGSLDALTE